MVERAVKEVHADDPERFLLIDIRFVQHPNVYHDLTGLTPRLGLKTDAEPAVGFVMLLETPRRDGVGKNEKSANTTEFFVEALDEKAVFVIEHRLETVPT